MDHPEYLSPFQKVLRHIFLHIMATGGICAEQTKWIITGTAAILGVLVANLKTVSEVVSGGALKYGICSLTVSILVGAVVYLFAVAVQQTVFALQTIHKELGTPDSKASMEMITVTTEQINSAMAEPFYGPLKIYMKRSANKGAVDFLMAEKRGVRTMCTVCYLSILQCLLASSGLIFLAFGLK